MYKVDFELWFGINVGDDYATSRVTNFHSIRAALSVGEGIPRFRLLGSILVWFYVGAEWEIHDVDKNANDDHREIYIWNLDGGCFWTECFNRLHTAHAAHWKTISEQYSVVLPIFCEYDTRSSETLLDLDSKKESNEHLHGSSLKDWEPRTLKPLTEYVEGLLGASQTHDISHQYTELGEPQSLRCCNGLLYKGATTYVQRILSNVRDRVSPMHSKVATDQSYKSRWDECVIEPDRRRTRCLPERLTTKTLVPRSSAAQSLPRGGASWMFTHNHMLRLPTHQYLSRGA